jgi:hypothetical protein
VEKAPRAAGSSVGNDESDIKVVDRSAKADGGLRLGEVNHNAARLDAELALQFLSQVVEQRFAAGSEHHINSGTRQLPGEFRPYP